MGGTQTEPVKEALQEEKPFDPSNPMSEEHKQELNKFTECMEDCVKDLKEVKTYQEFRNAQARAEKRMDALSTGLLDLAQTIIPTGMETETPNSGAEGPE